MSRIIVQGSSHLGLWSITFLRRAGVQLSADCCIWLRCGPKVHMFQLYNGKKLDVNGSSASVAAAWNWIPAPSSVLVGTTFLHMPVLQDGSVELPPHLVETLGMTEANPLLIEPSKSLGSSVHWHAQVSHHCSHALITCIDHMLQCQILNLCLSCRVFILPTMVQAQSSF